jgi:hypothetical protein
MKYLILFAFLFLGSFVKAQDVQVFAGVQLRNQINVDIRKTSTVPYLAVIVPFGRIRPSLELSVIDKWKLGWGLKLEVSLINLKR